MGTDESGHFQIDIARGRLPESIKSIQRLLVRNVIGVSDAAAGTEWRLWIRTIGKAPHPMNPMRSPKNGRLIATKAGNE